MLPVWLIKIALLLIIVRCLFVALTMLGHAHKHCLDILFYLAVVLVAIYFYKEQFHSFLGIF